MIEPLLPVRDLRKGGAARKYGDRLVLDGVFFVLRSGCQWRMIPRDLLPWDAAYRWNRTWAKDGTWDQNRLPHTGARASSRSGTLARIRTWAGSSRVRPGPAHRHWSGRSTRGMRRCSGSRVTDAFRPHEVGGYWVTPEQVDAVDRVVMDDLLGRHARAGIEVRITPSI